ncbi:hypothetical protein DYE49_06165 [Treponema rectale]|uniref:DUF1735 domain-containing protein n=1 Tax=Treponema rectale TaxID=744512 RepID=A0A840S984_9SPIR|nr:hypothetical protein [Treponema rectale]MBB5218237.1 hypothetical protein [Treponema rectale]QOS40060.1 hypothetical protein DYE49_06165 [Treponema rectale]
MKKIFGLLTAAVLFAGSFAFTGCDEVADELSGPENTWCELPVYVVSSKENGGDPDLYLDIIYCPEDYTGTTGDSNLDKNITLPAGITILAHAAVKIESLGMNAGSYTYKTFPIDAVDSDSNENSTYTFAGTKTKFTAIYWAKKELRDSDTQLALPKAPAAMSNTKTGYTELTDLTNFNWKTLLANYLLNGL